MLGLTSPKLLLAAIAGTGALLGSALIWVRRRQQREAFPVAQHKPDDTRSSTGEQVRRR